MRKLNVVFVILTIAFLGLNIGQFVFWKKINTETAAKYTVELANIQAQLDSIGSRVEVYTVSKAKKAGDLIEEEDIESLWTYSTLLTDQYVTNRSDIVGKYYKIAINPGTAITRNMVMDEEISDTTRDRDIILDRMTVGLQPGDYIDIRMTMPYGDDYIVLPHIRVREINDQTIKVYFDELQWATYQGALIDYFLNQEYGCVLYADKYVEPGLQQEAVAYYAVPDNIAALLQKNPNIIDKAEAASLNEWRAGIEEILVLFRTDADTVQADAGRLSSGRQTLTGAITSDFQTRKAELEQNAVDQALSTGDDTTTDEDDMWEDTP